MIAYHMFKAVYRFTAIILVLTFCVDYVSAQDTTTDQPMQLESMVVTGEKREEKIEDIPVSISAFSDLKIQDSGIMTIQDLSLEVPNLFIANWGIRGNSFVFIRGIGAINNEPAVGFYVDDVNYLDYRFFDSNLFDIERIEVLRGPQGTLYGRNSLAGVVNIVTKKPDNEFHAGGEYTLGTYNLNWGSLYMRTPIVDDKLFLGLSGGYEKRDGYTENDFLDKDVDYRDSYNTRMHLRFTPNDKLDITASVDGERMDDGAFPLGNLYQLRDNPHHVAYDHEGEYERDTLGGSLRVAYDAPWLKITSITAAREYDDEASNDQDFTIMPAITAFEEIDDEQFTQELRFASPDDSETFKWLTGFYYFSRERDHFLNLAFAPGIILPGMPVDRNTDTEIKTSGYAVFGQATYTLFDKLDITAGIRYDDEESEIERVTETESMGMTLDETSMDESEDYDAWLPKFQIAYHWTDHFMTYASAARGYRSGGFNSAHIEPEDASFDPEYSWNYEAGFKSSWFEKRLNFNMAFFYIDLEDQQVVQLLPTADTVIRNVGESKSTGFELETMALLSRGLTLEFNFGYTDAEYEDYDNPEAEEDFSGNKTPLAPKYTYTLALQYRRPVENDWNFFFRSEVNGIGRFYWNDANTLRQDDYEMVNVSIGLESKYWDLTLWAKNLFDEEYESVAFEFPGSDPIGQSGDPRTIGVTLRARF